MSDARLRLDALLADVPAPPVPAGLADRIAAAAAAAAQEPRAGPARLAAKPRHDRRRKWLRRPLLVGVGALGLALSGAVAATLAGVPIPAKIAAVFSQAFSGEKKAEPKAAPPRRARPPRPAPAPVRAQAAASEPPAAIPVPFGRAQRRLAIRRIVAERRAAGLPTPIADRAERRLRLWRSATPAQRAALREARRERLRQRFEARRAFRRDRIVPAPGSAREAGPVARAPVPIRHPRGGNAAAPARPVYGPIDPRTPQVRTEDSSLRLRQRDRAGEPVAGRRDAIRQRAPGPVVRRPVPTRARRR